MRILFAFFALCLAGTLFEPAATALAQEEAVSGLTLREKVVVDDGYVRLGDLFLEPLDNADIPVAEAPAPGKMLTIESRRLRHIAEAYGLAWRPQSKLQQVEITRLSQRITADMIEDQVRAAVAQVAHSASDLDIRFDRAAQAFDLPTDVDATLAVQDLSYDPIVRRFSATLVAPADGPALVKQAISGAVLEMVQVPVPARLISAGETLASNDLDWIWIETQRLSAFHLTDAAQIIGQIAKRPLRPGQPMRLTDIAQTPLVKKNGLIRLVVASGAMTLSVKARALEDGAYGQTVRVVNIDSNRQVSGVVQDSATVAITANDLAAIN